MSIQSDLVFLERILAYSWLQSRGSEGDSAEKALRCIDSLRSLRTHSARASSDAAEIGRALRVLVIDHFSVRGHVQFASDWLAAFCAISRARRTGRCAYCHRRIDT